ncbi:uncharacterized protein LOC130635839 [Hydractinia symbiolongicarpus]|uniref:uncharacterized protein LOC130635839 n=1 Tax=Hydractinia symbiolongicarpus TaxID=13093 RepID=UPI00254E4CD7|nr:uncharacterized protein LOC130635839 [Hydractinia symbiolongicarpus]
MQPYVQLPKVQKHIKFRYDNSPRHGFLKDENQKPLELVLRNAERGMVFVCLADEFGKLHPHRLSKEAGKKLKNFHCIYMKKDQPERLEFRIEVQRGKDMATRRVDCEYLSQLFTKNDVELTLQILNNKITSCIESDKERLKEFVLKNKTENLTKCCRLCVILVLPDADGKYTICCPPVYSDYIWNDNAWKKNSTSRITQQTDTQDYYGEEQQSQRVAGLSPEAEETLMVASVEETSDMQDQDLKGIQYVLPKLQQDEMHNIATPVNHKDIPVPELANENVTQKLVNDTNNNQLPDELLIGASIMIYDYSNTLFHLTHDPVSLYPTQKDCESWVAGLSPEEKEAVIAHPIAVMSHIPEYGKKPISVVDQLEKAFTNINYLSMMLVMYGVSDISSLFLTNKECELWAGLSPGSEESLEVPPIEETADVQGTKSEYAVVTDDVLFLSTETEAPQIQQDVTIVDIYFQGKDGIAHIVAPSESLLPKKGLSHYNENIVMINRSWAIHEQEDSSCKLPMLPAHVSHDQKHLLPSGSKRRIDAPSSSPSKTKVRIREKNDTDESVEKMFNGWGVGLNY